jgi:hypothetical protein
MFALSFTDSAQSVMPWMNVAEAAWRDCARVQWGRGVVTNGVEMMRLNGVDALMLYSETPEIHPTR